MHPLHMHGLSHTLTHTAASINQDRAKDGEAEKGRGRERKKQKGREVGAGVREERGRKQEKGKTHN